MEDDEHYSSSVLNENMVEKGSKEDHVSQEQSTTKQPLLEKGKIKKTPNMDYILKRYELIIKKEEQNIRFK